jgi:hypothetical protein
MLAFLGRVLFMRERRENYVPYHTQSRRAFCLTAAEPQLAMERKNEIAPREISAREKIYR